MDKTEKKVTINEQKKIGNTNTICLLINTEGWFCCKWKKNILPKYML